MPQTTTHTVDVPGAFLYYEVCGSGPVLALIGHPVDADEFTHVVPLLADDYTVVTYDPRGISRSTIDDPDQDATAELLADDVHRVLTAVTTEPAHVLGSSGGAITGLALATAHPRQARTLIAHEPPLVELLPDRVQVRAAINEVYDTYRREGQGAAWQKFFAACGFETPTGDSAQDLAMQSPSPQQLANGERMLAHGLRSITAYRPDTAALRSASTRIVIGAGTTSRGQLAHRTATALADQLDTALVGFPGDHEGFVSDPEPFAQALHHVLTETT